MSGRPEAMRRQDFRFAVTIQTRWSDNDMFGHLNNVEYYRFFELAVAEFLVGPCGLDLFNAPVMTFAAESLCRFRRPLSWPEKVTAGLAIEHVGNTSVRYAIALFRDGEEEAAADGHWVHVFVDRATQQPVPIPAGVRAVFEAHRLPGARA
ncbi:MAG: acyl-CoA thioesterase [Solirubrobacterales bacterium]